MMSDVALGDPERSPLSACRWRRSPPAFSIVGLGVLAPELKVDLGLSTAEVGFLTSLVFIGSMITSRRAGRLTDAAGPARVLGFSLAAAAASLRSPRWRPRRRCSWPACC